MPTPMTHAFVGANLSVALPGQFRGTRAAVGCALLSAMPDLDIVGFLLGVPYSNTLGHRGMTHGLPFAVAVAAAVALTVHCLAESNLGASIRLFIVLSLVVGSHGVLDMATDGGLGVGLLIPFQPDRVFLPFRPIQVSPLSPSRFLSEALSLFVSEVLWVWVPGVIGLILFRLIMRSDHPTLPGAVENGFTTRTPPRS